MFDPVGKILGKPIRDLSRKNAVGTPVSPPVLAPTVVQRAGQPNQLPKDIKTPVPLSNRLSRLRNII
jgi:hypothetical protein